MAKFKDRVREITDRRRGVKASTVLEELRVYVRGWGGYYARLTESAYELTSLDSWMRRRLRQYLWVQWKTPRNRFRQLVKGGVNRVKARSACVIPGLWKAANSYEIRLCLSNALFVKHGFIELAKLHKRQNSS